MADLLYTTAESDFKPGLYTITAFGGKGGFVARSPVEDTSLLRLPKGIIARAKSASPEGNQWEIKKDEEGYAFFILGNPVISDGASERLLATPEDDPPLDWRIWRIKRDTPSGPNIYSISNSTNGAVWFVKNDSDDFTREQRSPSALSLAPAVYPHMSRQYPSS